MTSVLHITALELLAAGVNAIVFHPILVSSPRVLLRSDALATPAVLSRHSAKSPALRAVHERLLANRKFNEVAEKAEICHLFGEANLASDSASRGRVELVQQLCRLIGVREERWELPTRSGGI